MVRADSTGAPEPIDGELVELELGERTNGFPPVAEEEGGEPRTGDRSPPGRRRGRLLRRLSPASVARACRRWLRHPAHLALLAWALCVAASGAMLVLLLLGALDGAFPQKSARNRWIEVNNQVLNALFTLMSIYQHPALFHHAVMLLRWRPDDGKALRKAYCRKGATVAGDGACRERLHMSVVVALLHVACFAQYAMCGLYWGYSRKARPDAAETSLAVIGAATPALAGLYVYFSPLGRNPRTATSVHHQEPDDLELAAADVVVVEVGGGTAEWAGGLLDVGDDPAACWLSCLCTFCVFGWNMERLGLGNMHVHAVMFALLCFAPLWVLNVAAMNIRDEAVGDAVGAAGVALCALGLLYGGYWRARMRRRFGLPGHGGDACCGDCGSPSLADYLRWMFCWGCALAQEVRTANVLLLDGEEAGGAGGGSSGGGRGDATLLQPLPRENGVKLVSHRAAAVPVDTDTAYVQPVNGSPRRGGGGGGGGGDESPLLQRQQGRESPSEEMLPPLPPLMTEAECRRVQ